MAPSALCPLDPGGKASEGREGRGEGKWEEGERIGEECPVWTVAIMQQLE